MLAHQAQILHFPPFIALVDRAEEGKLPPELIKGQGVPHLGLTTQVSRTTSVARPPLEVGGGAPPWGPCPSTWVNLVWGV